MWPIFRVVLLKSAFCFNRLCFWILFQNTGSQLCFRFILKTGSGTEKRLGTGRQGERQKQCATNQIFVDCLDADLNVHR